MAERAALITGASGGIGLAIAAVLAEEGYGLTLSARRPEKLEDAVAHLCEAGHEVETVAANVGIGAPAAEIQSKFLDMQLAVNLRSVIMGTREGLPLLRKAGAEHRKA